VCPIYRWCATLSTLADNFNNLLCMACTNAWLLRAREQGVNIRNEVPWNDANSARRETFRTFYVLALYHVWDSALMWEQMCGALDQLMSGLARACQFDQRAPQEAPGRHLVLSSPSAIASFGLRWGSMFPPRSEGTPTVCVERTRLGASLTRAIHASHAIPCGNFPRVLGETKKGSSKYVRSTDVSFLHDYLRKA